MPFENSSDQIIEATIEFREFFNHHLVDNFSGLVVHDFVDSVIHGVGWVLKFFEERIEQC